MFAAFEVATGKVTVAHKQRRGVEFLDLINRIVAAAPEPEIHVILDNLSTHKPKRDLWLARHKNVRFRFTPIHASCSPLSQVECCFFILASQSLQGASFTAVPKLRRHIDAFVGSRPAIQLPFSGDRFPDRSIGNGTVGCPPLVAKQTGLGRGLLSCSA